MTTGRKDQPAPQQPQPKNTLEGKHNGGVAFQLCICISPHQTTPAQPWEIRQGSRPEFTGCGTQSIVSRSCSGRLLPFPETTANHECSEALQRLPTVCHACLDPQTRANQFVQRHTETAGKRLLHRLTLCFFFGYLACHCTPATRNQGQGACPMPVKQIKHQLHPACTESGILFPTRKRSAALQTSALKAGEATQTTLRLVLSFSNQEASEADTAQLAKRDCCVSTSLSSGVTASNPRQTICAQSLSGCFWVHTGGKLRVCVRLQLVRPCARHDMMTESPGRWAMETNGTAACNGRRVALQTQANFS